MGEFVPVSWQAAARRGGVPGVRAVRTRADYRTWYACYANSGLVVPAWPQEYGGLGLSESCARTVTEVLAPFDLRHLNQIGLNNTAAALFAYGTEEQKRRFLPPIVANEEHWCQLFSEPGAGSDLASLATRAEAVNGDWVVNGQKVWTTWAAEADFAILLARTDPDATKHQGITYYLVDLRQPGVTIRPLRQMTGEAEFNEVFLDDVSVPDTYRVGPLHGGWKVAAATLSSERQMVAAGTTEQRPGIGAAGAERLITLADERGRLGEPVVRDRLMRLLVAEQVHSWNNERVKANRRAGHAPGPVASIGKIQQAVLNQQLQVAAFDLHGLSAFAWEDEQMGVEPMTPERYRASLPRAVHALLRSRANSIEGGTTEINKNILAERVLGLPREPDQWFGKPWREIPRT